MAERRIPRATYRFQFNGEFRFADARALVPYLKALGIPDIYASPLLKSRKRSAHGYDVIDPSRIDPELGTEADFNALIGTLRDNDMGLLLDIVPNHMAANPENPWWKDVQERGKGSPFYRYFDMEWLSKGGYPGYRRFFDVGDLAGVRVDDPDVFLAVHERILELIAGGEVTGLRIDHIDGLRFPGEYLVRLQNAIAGPDGEATPGERFYIVVENILAEDEDIPGGWPVDGTTGYEFSQRLNRLSVSPEGLEALDGIYRRFTGNDTPFSDLAVETKKRVMREIFSEEIRAMGRILSDLSGRVPGGTVVPPEAAEQALAEATARLPVYRTYIADPGTVSPGDRARLETTFDSIPSAADEGSQRAIDVLRRVLLLEFPDAFPEGDKRSWLDFVLDWQQLTGAITAKGVEDTAFYHYFRLLSMNEVGGDPGAGGIDPAEFHEFILRRAGIQPHGMNTTSTHDTKRSEDVRARINVISECVGEWEHRLERWSTLNGPKKTVLRGLSVPAPDTEYFIYQTLLGAWPLDTGELPSFHERLNGYLVKAMREAKRETGWVSPDEEYEGAVLSFAAALLDERADNRFLADFLEFSEKIAWFGMLNSLAQLLLKVTLPGIPDFYQGTDLWDFSLVDPDNRRPVDYERRIRYLEEIIREEGRTGYSSLLLKGWRDGRLKAWMTRRALAARKEYPELFRDGGYIPLEVSGTKKEHVFAFARSLGDERAVVIVPRLTVAISPAGVPPCGDSAWGSTMINLREERSLLWKDHLTGKTVTGGGEEALYMGGVLNEFPFALLTRI